MPTPTKGPRLGGGPAHERLMLANLATSLFEHDRITTTEAKAKRLRPLAERLITFAKRGDLHARRQVMTVIRDKDVVHKLFAEIGPKFADASGWLHPHRQDQPAQGRQRADGDHRAGRGTEVGRGRGREGARHQGRAEEGPDRPHQGDRRGRRGRVGDGGRGRGLRRRGRGTDRDRGRRGRARGRRGRGRPGRSRPELDEDAAEAASAADETGVEPEAGAELAAADEASETGDEKSAESEDESK